MSNGIIEIFLRTGAPDVADYPDTGYKYLWLEEIASETILRYKDSLAAGGTVGNVGTSGTSTSKWELVNGALRPLNNEEIWIGKPGAGASASFGEGDSYNDEITVLSFDGTSYVDETSKILSEDANRLTFPNTSVNTAIYICSDKQGGGDYIPHYGTKLYITAVATLGSGDIAFEYYNGSSWVEFNHMTVHASPPYTHYANELFASTGEHYYYYDLDIRNSIAKVTVNSLNRYWIRMRIVGNSITTSPEFDKIKLHSNHAEFKSDGTRLKFGTARTLRKLPLTFGAFNGANDSPDNQDIYLSDTLGIGRTENDFENNVIDRTGFCQMIPLDMDTSTKLELTAYVFSNATGNARFNIRWATSTDGDDCYTSTISSPTTAPNQRSQTIIIPLVAGKITGGEVEIDIPEALLHSAISGIPDLLWLTMERDATHETDTVNGSVFMIDFAVFYHAWRDGGYTGAF